MLDNRRVALGYIFKLTRFGYGHEKNVGDYRVQTVDVDT